MDMNAASMAPVQSETLVPRIIFRVQDYFGLLDDEEDVYDSVIDSHPDFQSKPIMQVLTEKKLNEMIKDNNFLQLNCEILVQSSDKNPNVIGQMTPSQKLELNKDPSVPAFSDSLTQD